MSSLKFSLARHAVSHSAAVSPECFDLSWQPMLSVLVGLGRAAGADFVEFFLERRRLVSCLSENGRVTGVSPSLGAGAGVRIFVGKSDYFASTNDLSYSGLKSTLEKTLSMAQLQMPVGDAFVPEIYFEPFRDYGVIKSKNAWLTESPALKEITESLLRSDAILKKKTSHLQTCSSSYTRDWQEVLVASSDGIFARDIRLAQHLGHSGTVSEGAHRSSLTRRSGGTSNPNFLRLFDWDASGDSLANSLGTMLRADYAQSGACPVIMANAFGGVIFHEACGHLLETDQINSKATPFADSKGKIIAHENLTAWDEGVEPGDFGSIDMDDEGMPAQRTLLIENGVLKNFISDRMGNIRTGHPRTGSGRRQNYGFAASSRMRNTYIGTGKFKKEDLFASVDKGIYCQKMGGGSVDATGRFNFAVSEAYMIENGKITKPLKGATLVGSAVDIMKNISMSADDHANSAGFCGSKSGSIYTCVGQPHIKVDNITVGGR